MPDLSTALDGTDGPPRARTGGQGQRGRLARRALAALGLASVAALAFGLALAMTAPAQVLTSLVTLPPQVEGLSGTVWQGRAALRNGYRLSWNASSQDFWRLRLGADVTLEGVDTRLVGHLEWTPWQVAATGVSGRAGPGLLALAPRLLVEACTSTATLEVPRLALGRTQAEARGEATLAAGACALRDGGEVPVPALRLDLSTDGADARASLSDVTGTTLATVSVVGGDTLRVRVEPAGASLVPGMPASAATELEFPL